MMGDMEMVYLQKRDCASCAVWEWIKSDCWRRTSPDTRTDAMSLIEKEGVAESLGLLREDGTGDAERFDTIVNRMINDVGWINEKGEIGGWDKWQSVNTKIEDAARKRADYWEKRSEESDDLTIPSELDTPEFQAAWELLLQYRIDRKLPRYRPVSIIAMWDKFVKWGGSDVAVAAIQQTISNGWQGVFEPKGMSSSPQASAVKAEVPYEKKFWALTHHKKNLEEQLQQLREWGGKEKAPERKELAAKIKDMNKQLSELDPT